MKQIKKAALLIIMQWYSA